MSKELQPILDPTRECMLTTVDNPYNPFTQWDEWLRYDRDHGYYTNEYLARVALTDEELSDEDNATLLRYAMYTIAEFNPTNLYVLRFKEKKN